MTIHSVTIVEDNVLRIHMLERNHAPIFAHNCLCAWILVRAILYELVQLITIMNRDTLRIGKIRRNLNRYTQLSNRNVGIWSDNRTRAELYALTLNIEADTAFL